MPEDEVAARAPRDGREAHRRVGPRAARAGDREPGGQRAPARRAGPAGHRAGRGTRGQGGALGAQPRGADSARAACRVSSSRSSAACGRERSTAASGSVCTSSGRSPWGTGARSGCGRPRRRARRSPSNCRPTETPRSRRTTPLGDSRGSYPGPEHACPARVTSGSMPASRPGRAHRTRTVRGRRPALVEIRADGLTGIRGLLPRLRRSAARFLDLSTSTTWSSRSCSPPMPASGTSTAAGGGRTSRPTSSAFPAGEAPPGSTGPWHLGDVILSLDTARRQARAPARPGRRAGPLPRPRAPPPPRP